MKLFSGTPSDPAFFIGLMSGTSLDGVDTVLCRIDSSSRFSLLYAQTYPIPEPLKKNLLSLSQDRQNNELDLYAELDVQMGHLFADCCLLLLEKHHLKAEQICAIGSHGQTLRHYPEQRYPSTLQIGDPNIIAWKTGITTIADFRRKDMAAGGQGAPLVPPFHQALFSSEKNNRAIVNIGGIANITFLPADDTVLGYDTGPGNGLMDNWCSKHFNCAYDHSGQLAEQGTTNKELLSLFLTDPFFSQKAPKSTGREYFSYQWIIDKIKQYQSDISKYDVLATLLELSCISISNEVLSLKPVVDELLVCGGGASNTLLMQHLKTLLPQLIISSTEKYGLHPDWVEACAFAWLAHQTLHGLNANLPSVTGAEKAVILGAVWQA